MSPVFITEKRIFWGICRTLRTLPDKPSTAFLLRQERVGVAVVRIRQRPQYPADQKSTLSDLRKM
jgi:hypothetical protein